MIEDIDTPALLLDVDQMQANLRDIVHFAKKNGVAYRPHIKTHKSVEIAKRQLAAGAIGVTVAKVGEAEVMVAGGIKDILIAFPVVSASKLKRIMQLMNHAKMTVTIDSIEQADILNTFFSRQEKEVNVWIKVNSGLNRVGVEPNEEVVTLAKHIDQLPMLVLMGIFTHAGHSYGATSQQEVEEIANAEAEAVLKSVALCEENNITIPHRSVGSTPTFKHSGKFAGITEIRPGNAIFYDMVQVGLGVCQKNECALTVQASIVSKKQNRLVLDAGSKALALDQGAHGNATVKGHGYIKEHPHFIIERLSEEHGVIPISAHHDRSITSRLTIIPNHACTVVNLFDYYHVHKGGKVIDKWKVDARGRVD